MDERLPDHPLAPYPPLIINAALTGMVGRRRGVPALPVTAEQIERDAWVCHCLGASILHLHLRDRDEAPAWSPDRYGELIERVRERCPEAVICVSTSGRKFPDLERRAAVLALQGRAKPDMASLTLGSLNFQSGPSVSDPETIRALAARMRDAGIKAELEVFDSGMAHGAHALLDDGLLEAPLYANVMLGSHHSAPASIRELSHLIDSLPPARSGPRRGSGHSRRSPTAWLPGPVDMYEPDSRTTSAFSQAVSRQPTPRSSPGRWRPANRPVAAPRRHERRGSCSACRSAPTPVTRSEAPACPRTGQGC